MATGRRGSVVRALCEIVDTRPMSDRAIFPAHEAELGTLLAWIDRAACALGAPREITVKLRIIAEELFTNTLNHGGNTHRPDATVTLALERAGTSLWLHYEDQGPAHDPFAPNARAALDRPVEERPVGGLGIVLIQGFAEATRYRRAADRNCIEVALRIGPAANPDGSQR